ncbi:MAG TPA: DUF3347 domain-containing protein [Daejeonella sp.]|jgi:hypothetical protein|uniref:DUF3347 domain-containing protein n=1 Tax=Daejeonella sp. TaxID=2805397 RepID=UPI002ED99EAB
MYNIKLSISIFALVALFAACNQTQENKETPAGDSLVTVPAVEVELRDTSINQAFKYYEDLKNVLVTSNASEARTAASELAIALRKVKGSENTAVLADKIAASTDLSEQRTTFTALSNDVITLFKQSEISSGSIYVQYCPMANEGEGGYWLSSQEEIMNPYYGDEMLHCGEVKETITKK